MRYGELSILDSIFTSNDVKKLKQSQLPQLCLELREFLIDNLSKTGGHLSSNLGAVELTVAMHRVYDSARDRLVFDVGHQSYAHKILTGRRDEFSTLRCLGGISGFPKPCESINDAFIAGHASNSISVALGMARARTLAHENYDVATIVGDGALTGGLAYEGLSDAGESGESIVIILNDNGMAINKNVGGIAKLLSHQRIRPGYFKFKRLYRRILKKVPPVYNLLHGIKEKIKKLIIRSNIFEDLGLYYLGPVDGNDVNRVEAVLGWARELKQPVLVHLITKKGKGYIFAEDDPETYHGVSSFDCEEKISEQSKKMCFSKAFGDKLRDLASKDDKIVAITAAMANGTGLSEFAEKYPERFFDVGIAEGHAVSMAAGMAKQGLKPVFAVYSTFLQRGYDMLIHDVSLLRLHVVFAVDRAGLVGGDGETHHGTFDVGYLCSVPGMTVLCPSNYAELGYMLEQALFNTDTPVAVRYPRGREGKFKDLTAGKLSANLRSGTDITMVGYGIMINEILAAADILAKEGIRADVIKLNSIKPLDVDKVMTSVISTGRLIVAEDVCAAGCVGQRLLYAASSKGINLKASRLLNLGSGIVTHGDIRELIMLKGIDSASIAAAAMDICRTISLDNEKIKT
jgi:1-deoxy-D-xylulose-5-phosphate synthase